MVVRIGLGTHLLSVAVLGERQGLVGLELFFAVLGIGLRSSQFGDISYIFYARAQSERVY